MNERSRQSAPHGPGLRVRYFRSAENKGYAPGQVTSLILPGKFLMYTQNLRRLFCQIFQSPKVAGRVAEGI